MTMIPLSCHCGAVRLALPRAPEALTSCNCSLCRRLGALWGYYEPVEVTVEAAPDALQSYVQGDRTLATMRCAHCGVVTHWTPLLPEHSKRMGVNLRNAAPEVLAAIRVRRFDGADTWEFLD